MIHSKYPTGQVLHLGSPPFFHLSNLEKNNFGFLEACADA